MRVLTRSREKAESREAPDGAACSATSMAARRDVPSRRIGHDSARPSVESAFA